MFPFACHGTRMMNKFARLAVIGATCAMLAVAGCDQGSGGPYATGDSGTDAAGDLTVETISDTATDSIADNGRDADVDAGEDVALDADDAAVDADDDGLDADNDATPEVLKDAVEDTTPPPLWEDLAPTGVNTIRNTIGVSSHMYQGPGDNAERNFEFEKYRELGAATIREDYHWNAIEPADDQWNMDHVKGQVDMAMEAGCPIVPMFGYENGWAQTGGASTIDMEEYGEYVGHVAAQHCAYIKDYEIWNEENIPRFWSGKPDPEAYGRMMKAAHAAIKAACPDARVAFGGMSSYDAETDLSDRYGFLERVWQEHPDICDYFEIVAFHPYTFLQYDPPERDVVVDETLQFQGQSAQTAILRGILSRMACTNKALMITEQGWPSYDLTEEQVGRFLPRSLLLAARDGVEKYMWYTFWDGYPTTEGVRPHESYFGLFGWTGEDGTVRRAKPVWHSYKAAADILGDKTFARDISAALGLPNDVYALAFMNPDGDITVAAWDGRDFPDQSYGTDGPGGETTTFAMTMPLPPLYTDAVVHDIFGAVVESPTGYTISDSDVPATLTIVLTPSIQYISPTLIQADTRQAKKGK